MWTRTRKRLVKLRKEKEEKAKERAKRVEDWTRKPSMLFAIEHSVDVYDRSNSGKQRVRSPEKISKRKEMERTFGDQIRQRIYPGKRFLDSSPINTSQNRARRKRTTTTTTSPKQTITSKSQEMIKKLQNEILAKDSKLKTLRQSNQRLSTLASKREVKIRELARKCRDLQRDLTSEKSGREKDKKMYMAKIEKLKRFGSARHKTSTPPPPPPPPPLSQSPQPPVENRSVHVNSLRSEMKRRGKTSAHSTHTHKY